MRSTAADISLQGLANFRSAWMLVLLEQRDATDDHSGSAIRALECAVVDKGLLNGMKLAELLEPFNGDDRFSCRVADQKLARSPGRAIQKNSAGATLAFAATVLRSRETKLFT